MTTGRWLLGVVCLPTVAWLSGCGAAPRSLEVGLGIDAADVANAGMTDASDALDAAGGDAAATAMDASAPDTSGPDDAASFDVAEASALDATAAFDAAEMSAPEASALDATDAADASAPDAGATEASAPLDAGGDAIALDASALDASALDATAPFDAADATSPATDGTTGSACVIVDASLVDGEILGLPTQDVPVTPPVVTPQVAVTAPALHYQKAVGVLNLSPNVKDAQAVVHMLAPMGIPYAVTTSPVLAIAHDMAIFFPEASPYAFDATALALLDDYVRGGGVVLMKYSEVDALKALGGVASSVFQGRHQVVNLTELGKARFPSLDQPAEQTIPLGGDATEFLNTWAMTVDPSASGVHVLATFDPVNSGLPSDTEAGAPDDGDGGLPESGSSTGGAAIVDHQVGAGHVITFGVDWRDVVLRNQLGHAINAARGYMNVFEPATDAWMLMIRDVYDQTVRFGVRLHTAPAGARSALLVSHDLDWGESYSNAIQYAADEKSHGASATYFIHTKYVTDSQDVAFFGPEREPQLATILAGGGLVGSHTVAHSSVLHDFPLGDGTESYPSYAPYNVSIAQTTGGTLFGELRVSKSLIDGAFAAQCIVHDVVSFRAGNLDYHEALPQTLERLGYRFDSTRPIGEVLSNFPFRAMTDWPDALDTGVFEFPVVIEDQLPPRIDQRVADTLSIIGANADNGAPTTLLIHPNVLDYKENAEKAILDGLPPGVRAMSVDEYAIFWRGRDNVTIAGINFDDEKKQLTVALTAAEAVRGLTLRVDRSVQSVVSPSSATLIVGAHDSMVVLPALAAGSTLVLVLGYS